MGRGNFQYRPVSIFNSAPGAQTTALPVLPTPSRTVLLGEQGPNATLGDLLALHSTVFLTTT